MPAFAYLVSILLVFPALAFALFFEALTLVIETRTLGNMLRVFGRVLWRIISVIDAFGGPWIVLVAAALAVIAMAAFVSLAFNDRWRFAGLAVIGIVGVLSALSCVVRATPRDVGEALFLVPPLLAIALVAWQLSIDPRVASLRGV